ncbi:enoyl-CoA hydratase/isomerase family protein [Ancylobacter dichloromethanicus]|uniref:Enoyl-CoA hydratase n=1 Tax=Ancylobacter dichloromethanicus TaxID=518825 RepID=A0A9W6JA47_9HYPH|nr:enoyl-CoA hydratase [Ancylobacter dichloromethanicus]MBS7552716.1 enoyl-CoA hydratase/isomerase family protein [Ancylobacter dichloromethanicus]GLK72080.1 enoyl-CoA hydratase [Ancylobacter dichloromethanicus]
MSSPRIDFEKAGEVAFVRFNNPEAHNALTGQMWLDLRDAALRIADDPSIRVAVFRGVGGKAFVSGTDITGFTTFASGADGVAYEHRIDDCMSAVDAIPVTTLAVVDGWAVGGGLNIASACDFRLATPGARFGSPIGRTLGNCLSALSMARIGDAVGVGIAKRMVLLGEIVTAQEMLDNGFLLKIAEPEAMDAEIEALCRRAAENAPLTTRATKATVRALALGSLPDIEAMVAQVYGSEDFRRGVADFLARTKAVPKWTGR